MSQLNRSFADELRERIAPQAILFFLRVEKRGLEFPLNGMEIGYRRVFVVPGMILAVVEECPDHLVAKWYGPTLQPEYKNHKNVNPYSESISFVMDIDNSHVVNGSITRIAPSKVIKMPNHVPAVLY